MRVRRIEKTDMRELHRWAKGKPKNLVMIAQQLAVGAEAHRPGGQALNLDIGIKRKIK